MAGRLINITKEILYTTHNEELKSVFFTSPGESPEVQLSSDVNQFKSDIDNSV